MISAKDLIFFASFCGTAHASGGENPSAPGISDSGNTYLSGISLPFLNAEEVRFIFPFDAANAVEDNKIPTVTVKVATMVIFRSNEGSVCII